jgi:hypothetical protein
MATAANGREEKRVEQHETRIPLTPTGLLMEAIRLKFRLLSVHFTWVRLDDECNSDFSTTMKGALQKEGLAEGPKCIIGTTS